MSDKFATEVDPAAMTAMERTQFFDELFAVYDDIFDGYTRADFEAGFTGSEVVGNRILVFRDTAGSMVGFIAARHYQYEVLGRRRDVFRSTAAMKPAYRGGNSTIVFGLRVSLGHMLRNPGRPAYYFGSMLHPSSYYVLSKYAIELWPRHDRDTPAEVDQLILAFAAARGYEFDDPPTPYVRLARERTRQGTSERDFWRTSDNPAVQFFVATNPRYEENRGLVTLIPLTWTNMLLSGIRFLAIKLRRRLRGRTSRG